MRSWRTAGQFGFILVAKMVQLCVEEIITRSVGHSVERKEINAYKSVGCLWENATQTGRNLNFEGVGHWPTNALPGLSLACAIVPNTAIPTERRILPLHLDVSETALEQGEEGLQQPAPAKEGGGFRQFTECNFKLMPSQESRIAVVSLKVSTL